MLRYPDTSQPLFKIFTRTNKHHIKLQDRF